MHQPTLFISLPKEVVSIVSYTLDNQDVMSFVEEKRELLERYAALVMEANQNVRLVGPRETRVLWEQHILDCAYTLPFLPDSGKVVDLGSGAGLPGIVWAICRPDLQVTLCESVGKKARFLEETVLSLGLTSCTVAGIRSEELGANQGGTFSLVGARGVSHLGVLGEYASPLLCPGGDMLAMKGEKVREEMAEIGNRWDSLGFGEPRQYGYTLSGGERHWIVILPKEGETPHKYPRRPGMAEKRRWW